MKQVLQILANRFSSLYFLMILKACLLLHSWRLSVRNMTVIPLVLCHQILSGFGMVLAVNHFIACSWYGSLEARVAVLG